VCDLKLVESTEIQICLYLCICVKKMRKSFLKWYPNCYYYNFLIKLLKISDKAQIENVNNDSLSKY
jgi:hypothetical protein